MLDEADAVSEESSFAALLNGVFIREGRATTDGVSVSLACALDSDPTDVADGPEVAVVAAAASDVEAETEAGIESVEGAEVVICRST